MKLDFAWWWNVYVCVCVWMQLAAVCWVKWYKIHIDIDSQMQKYKH